MPKPTVFLSYSHQDEIWKDRVQTHLEVLGEIDVWSDRRIELGTTWRPEIQAALERADVAVLLVSANFLTSGFILKEEVPVLLQRRKKDGLLVIPVIVRPCAWQAQPWLASVQAHPKDARPISKGRKAQVDEDLAALALKVRELLGPSPDYLPPVS
jgi:TIR domain